MKKKFLANLTPFYTPQNLDKFLGTLL